MKTTHPAHPHVAAALLAVREGRHVDAQHAIQAARSACTQQMRPNPPDLGVCGDLLRVLEVHSNAAWTREPDPDSASGAMRPALRPAGDIETAPTVQALQDILAGKAVHA